MLLAFSGASAVEPLEITAVIVDFDTSEISIHGVNFDNGNDLEINLSDIGQISSVDVSAELIVASFPVAGLPAGNYVLSITSGGGSVRYDDIPITVGTTGPTGPQGEPGPQGLTGDTGPQGPQGPVGPEGPQGLRGLMGPQGADGALGPQGLTGDTGSQGPQGPAGADGAQGLQGLMGPQGADGALGPQGLTGDTGSQGPQGSAGADGAQGPQGVAGADGAQGPQGLQGVAGAEGSQGPQGPEGPPGPSTELIYEVGGYGPAGIVIYTSADGKHGIEVSRLPIEPSAVNGALIWDATDRNRVPFGCIGQVANASKEYLLKIGGGEAATQKILESCQTQLCVTAGYSWLDCTDETNQGACWTSGITLFSSCGTVTGPIAANYADGTAGGDLSSLGYIDWYLPNFRELELAWKVWEANPCGLFSFNPACFPTTGFGTFLSTSPGGEWFLSSTTNDTGRAELTIATCMAAPGQYCKYTNPQTLAVSFVPGGTSHQWHRNWRAYVILARKF